MSVNNNESDTNIWSDPDAVLSCASLIGELIMSANNINEPDASMNLSCCASCGTAEGDDIKLKTCTACKSVRYCSVECQRNHRPKHKKACKKRAAELRDELLFRQPESTHLGDCPICFLPLPIGTEQTTMMECCSKLICNGCQYANLLREMYERLVEHKCAFCRDPIPTQKSDVNKNTMKRVEANDPMALCFMSHLSYEEGNYADSFKYSTMAAEMGDADSHYRLSILYWRGRGVEKDEKKEMHHLEKAAIGGHPAARYNLGVHDLNKGRLDRAVKHYIIAANLGHDASIQEVKDLYAKRFVCKEDFAAALRAHHAAVDAMKSPQREAAEAVGKDAAEDGFSLTIN